MSCSYNHAAALLCSVQLPILSLSRETPWHGSVRSTVVLLLYGCLFKPSRMLPRRDCHAWANPRTQNQILLYGKLLVACQGRFCSLYLNNQASQAWPPLSFNGRPIYTITLSSCLSLSFGLKTLIQIDRRDEGSNTSHKWWLKTHSSFWIVFPLSPFSFLCL